VHSNLVIGSARCEEHPIGGEAHAVDVGVAESCAIDKNTGTIVVNARGRGGKKGERMKRNMR
jgi:hypothetical protein